MNLKKIRKLSGLTQEKVAERAGITTNAYAKLERGDSNLKDYHIRLFFMIAYLEAKGLEDDFNQFILENYL